MPYRLASLTEQFALFAFFILNRAKGSAISTGCLFFITLGIKIM